MLARYYIASFPDNVLVTGISLRVKVYSYLQPGKKGQNVKKSGESMSQCFMIKRALCW